MEAITRTIYGSFLQTCLYMGLPFSLKANSTLNEKFGINQDIAPSAADIPKVRYWAIGNGGHTMSVGGDGIAKPEPLQHRARDAALFKHLPFVLREITNDLTGAQQANYGLRRVETWNGVQYFAYYLKRLDLSAVAAQMQFKTVADGNTTTTVFTPDSSDLNPVPQGLSASGINVVSGDYVTTSAQLPLILSPDDVSELLNVANVMYGDDNYAIISEIGLVSGIDKVVSSPGAGGSQINFNDVIAAQIATFINAFYPLKYSNNGTEVILDVGATEPLFTLG